MKRNWKKSIKNLLSVRDRKLRASFSSENIWRDLWQSFRVSFVFFFFELLKAFFLIYFQCLKNNPNNKSVIYDFEWFYVNEFQFCQKCFRLFHDHRSRKQNDKIQNCNKSKVFLFFSFFNAENLKISLLRQKEREREMKLRKKKVFF